MNQILTQFLIIIIIFHFSFEATTDCLANSGKNGEQCGKKSTFINVIEWSFIVEDDMAYKCCYYKGKLGSNDYQGCFAFFEDDINNYRVNDLLNEMEKGEWELALGVKDYNPSIDCLSKTINNNSNKIIFLLLILFIL